MADFSYEQTIWNRGLNIVAGMDEVGRGSFAGPVVAACVVYKQDILSDTSLKEIRINDSKKLSRLQREKADIWIRKNAFGWGVGSCSVPVINKFGIIKATNTAFRRAITEAVKSIINGGFSGETQNIYEIPNQIIDHLLIDAFYIPYVRGVDRSKQTPIVKGDSKSFSIASASIVAKVYRDRLMAGLGINSEYKVYCWEKNKGYGTDEHRKAILTNGITKYHRKKFVQTWLNKNRNLNESFRYNNLSLDV